MPLRFELPEIERLLPFATPLPPEYLARWPAGVRVMGGDLGKAYWIVSQARDGHTELSLSRPPRKAGGASRPATDSDLRRILAVLGWNAAREVEAMGAPVRHFILHQGWTH